MYVYNVYKLAFITNILFYFLLFLIEGRRFVAEDRNEGDMYDTIRLGMSLLF